MTPTTQLLVVECSCGARAGVSPYGIGGLYVIDRHWPLSGHGPCLQSGTVVSALRLAVSGAVPA